MYPSRFRYEAPRTIAEAIDLLASRRRRGQGAGRRPEPGAADEAALRLARADRRHQQPARPGLPPDRRRRHDPGRRTVPPRDARALDHPCHAATDDGRRRTTHRRPHRAQPGHAGRFALPRRPAGRLGGGGHLARRLRRRAGHRAVARSRSWTSSPGPFQTVLGYDEVAVEAVIPARKGTPAGGYLKLERRVGDFATAGAAVSVELSGGLVTQAGIALTGVGGSTINATEAAAALVGRPLGAETIARAADLAAAGRAAAVRPPRQRGVQAAHHPHVRRAHPEQHLRSPARGQPEMSSLFEEIAAEPAPTSPVRRVTITVNGQQRTADIEPRLLLAHLLRQGFRLTGTHTGCDTTNCGACTVLFDGQAVKSCTMLAVQADGHEVTTVEGLAGASELHPLQERLQGRARPAVRVLYAGDDAHRQGVPRREPRAHRGRGPLGAVRQPVPLHRLPEHREVGLWAAEKMRAEAAADGS